MTGKRIAIYGLGRSGLAIARAALALGAVPTVYDRALPEQMVKQDVLEAARDLGIDLKLGWEGRFDPSSLDLLVTNPGVDMRSPVLQQAKSDGIEILSEVEFAYRISQAPIVAITGTNGKSTTTVMTYLALRECGIDAVLCGNIFGTGLPEVPLTEAALHSTPDQVLVAEISSFQLEWVSQFSPAVAGITNIAPDHLDRYDSFQQYADTKMKIFAVQAEGAYAVVRAYDPQVRLIRVGERSSEPVRHGLKSRANHGLQTRATVYTFGAQGEQAQVLEEEIRILDKVIRTQDMQVIGTHNYANAAMAGLMAYATLQWLAAREQGEDTDTALIIRAQTGEVQAMELLVDSYRDLVERIVESDAEDGRKSAIDRGMEGLRLAVGRFDPTHGFRFSTYATHWIRQAIRKNSGGDADSQTLALMLRLALTKQRGEPRTVFGSRQRTNQEPQTTLSLPEPIVTALKAFKGIEHRMELLGSKNGVRIINNSMCTNPDAVVKSAQAVKGPNHLIMGGKDKDLPFAPVKNYLASGMHKGYLFGEAKEVLNEQLGGGFPTYNTLQEAFRAATEKARPGEVIMLAPGCASTDQFHDFRDRGNVFKKIAKEWLES